MTRSRLGVAETRVERSEVAFRSMGSYRLREINNQMSPLQLLLDLTLFHVLPNQIEESNYVAF